MSDVTPAPITRDLARFSAAFTKAPEAALDIARTGIIDTIGLILAARNEAVVQAVRTVAQGRKYITPEIAQMLVESLTMPVSENAHDKLSDRDMQTLVLIASGKRLGDIAEQLSLSPKTVSVYRARVLEKLGLQNNSELTVYAIRQGLVGD